MTEAKPEFVRQFELAWKEPRKLFPALFDPRGTLFQSGMERPIGATEIPAHQESTLKLLPDLAIRPTRWAVNGDDVFIEWSATGTFLGSALQWNGASRFTLSKGLVAEEVAYFDTLPLRAAADPSLTRADIVGVATDAQRINLAGLTAEDAP